jgi:MSHA pilin protein MshD
MQVIAMARPYSAAGFTLVETVATIVILAIALVGVASMVGLGSSNSANTLVQTRAIALAESYLDEILGRRFDERSAASGLDPCFGLVMGDPDKCTDEDDFGPDGGGESDRDKYDDVDDYDGLKEGDGETTAIADAEGNTRAEYANYKVEVSVRYAGDDAVPGLTETDAKLITVTITSRDQDTGWEFSAYRSNY